MSKKKFSLYFWYNHLKLYRKVVPVSIIFLRVSVVLSKFNLYLPGVWHFNVYIFPFSILSPTFSSQKISTPLIPLLITWWMICTWISNFGFHILYYILICQNVKHRVAAVWRGHLPQSNRGHRERPQILADCHR